MQQSTPRSNTLISRDDIDDIEVVNIWLYCLIIFVLIDAENW